MATQYRINTSATFAAPDNIDEMSQYIKRLMLEQHVKTIFKTKNVLEAIFGLGRVPAIDTAGRDVMEKLWHMVNTTWKELLNEGFAVADKKGRYRIKGAEDVDRVVADGVDYLLYRSGRSAGYEGLCTLRNHRSKRSLWYDDRRIPSSRQSGFMGDI